MHLRSWQSASISVVFFGALSIVWKLIEHASAETAGKTHSPMIAQPEALIVGIDAKERAAGMLVKLEAATALYVSRLRNRSALVDPRLFHGLSSRILSTYKERESVLTQTRRFRLLGI